MYDLSSFKKISYLTVDISDGIMLITIIIIIVVWSLQIQKGGSP